MPVVDGALFKFSKYREVGRFGYLPDINVKKKRRIIIIITFARVVIVKFSPYLFFFPTRFALNY